MSALCVASLRFAPVAAASAPKNSAVRKATAAVGPSRNAAPIARLALASSSSLAVAPAAFAATEHGNAILQLADSLEDTIPTIAIYASLAAVLWGSRGAISGLLALAGGEEATASHILVKDRSLAVSLLERLNDGPQDNIEDRFAREAGKYSECPSKSKGGSLGTFKPGQMVKEFNDAVFDGPVMEIQGPVQTQFGYHLILVTDRVEKEAK